MIFEGSSTGCFSVVILSASEGGRRISTLSPSNHSSARVSPSERQLSPAARQIIHSIETESSHMKSNEPSRTALMIARQRAAHQLLDRGSILHDPFAMKILREDEKEVLQFANAHSSASIGRLFTAARSRIAEDALSKAVERGVRQIVILGAGLDTFALRNPYATQQIRIYEVDHPATQTWKRQRLSEAEVALPPWLTFVPVDFEQDDLREKLAAVGFQLSSPAFFTWLGVVPYLTQEAIDRTLAYISSF